MEKTTKKKKKTKSLRRRIGVIAVGGLSLVLTVCLSVGATLAWFAGSTWSSEQLFMGGPVYVEMAGLGKSNGTAGGGQDAEWKGGSGNLMIQAATGRTTGTVTSSDAVKPSDAISNANLNKVLLPGQKYEIYSQARVFSTAYTSTDGNATQQTGNSGSNVTNTTNSTNGTSHLVNDGRVTTTTTSVLRARFTINVEFDPYVGFNNFKNPDYAKYYPVRSQAYKGDTTTASDVIVPGSDSATTTWFSALGANHYKDAAGLQDFGANSRRDAVNNASVKVPYTNALTNEADATATPQVGAGDLLAIKNGTKKSIYAWKFVSASTYLNDAITAKSNVVIDKATGAVTVTAGQKYKQMPSPFDGQTLIDGVGYYGVWILNDGTSATKAPTGTTAYLTESETFYKERCNSYLDSYVEQYITEYGGDSTKTIGSALKTFETFLNNSFIEMINDSSEAIHEGKVFGMTADNGIMTYAGTTEEQAAAAANTKCSWLYVDPKIGNDTNTNELGNGASGWWYLVETTGEAVATEGVKTEMDRVTRGPSDIVVTGTPSDSIAGTDRRNTPVAGSDFVRRTANATSTTDAALFYTDTAHGASDTDNLYAKLYEINPLQLLNDEIFGVNQITRNGSTVDGGNIVKVVSYSFPFVNGTNALDPVAMTNVFANAKITFQISFQALQAFFPYSRTIDGLTYKDSLLGTAKALNIKNAIPIYNEAFAY